jgi:hypothetical protein
VITTTPAVLDDIRKPTPVRHPDACGIRIPCPAHGLYRGLLPAEQLRNGWIVAHDCGRTWRPSEMPAGPWSTAL